MLEKLPFDNIEDAVQHMLSRKARVRSIIVMD